MSEYAWTENDKGQWVKRYKGTDTVYVLHPVTMPAVVLTQNVESPLPFAHYEEDQWWAVFKGDVTERAAWRTVYELEGMIDGVFAAKRFADLGMMWLATEVDGVELPNYVAESVAAEKDG